MKKAAHAVANQRLLDERLRRHWSQQEVADRVGTTPINVSRWERGITAPGAHFRMQLCTLFEKSAQALGLLPDDVLETIAATIILLDPIIPPAQRLVGRDALLRRLTEQLCKGSVVALHGLPGVGKAALAAALAHNRIVREHFCDGVLWTGLGPTPNLSGLLSRWGTLLGFACAEMERLTSVEAWVAALHRVMGTRHMLFVLDDVWQIEDAFALKVGGPGCSYLVTTRFADLACHWANGLASNVTELSEEDGVWLLSLLAPQAVAKEPEAGRALVQAVGGLPLGLMLVGKYLQVQAHGDQPGRLRRALERLLCVEERFRLTQPQAVWERPPCLPAGVTLSLQTTIEVSEQQLEPLTCSALRALSVFPAKPISFSEEAALAVCQVPADHLDRLVDSGLLESVGGGRYTLHQTIADYARLQLDGRATVEERMVRFFIVYVEAHRSDYSLLEQEMPNVLAALQLACTHEQWGTLIRGVHAFVPFLAARGAYAVVEPYLLRIWEAVQETITGATCPLGQWVGRGYEGGTMQEMAIGATACLHLGRIAELRGDYTRADGLYQEGLSAARSSEAHETMSALLVLRGEMLLDRGDYQQAEQYLQEGLALAQDLGDRQCMSMLLRSLGELADWGGRYQEGDLYYQQGLTLAREVGDRETMSALLQNIGVKRTLRGKYEEADACYQEALTAARQIGHRYRISAILLNMGVAAVKRERYQEAEAIYQEGLTIARELHYPLRISCLLQNLGQLAGLRNEYAEAAQYLQESLTLAKEMGHLWLLSEGLCEWGEICLKQEKVSEAEEAFTEALAKAQEMQGQEMIATASFGLARVARMQGDSAKAHEFAEKSLAIFQGLEHASVELVEQWLREELVT